MTRRFDHYVRVEQASEILKVDVGEILRMLRSGEPGAGELLALGMFDQSGRC